MNHEICRSSLTVIPATGTFTMSPAFEDQQIIDAETFCHLLLEKQHVSAVPGTAFGEPKNIRLNFAIPKDLITEALKRINNFTTQLAVKV
ncbi:hypothetical protein BK055_03610 [Bacillus velezensis]|nr:hypothetical protein BK055_03610 [Bacillus velezensis]